MIFPNRIKWMIVVLKFIITPAHGEDIDVDIDEIVGIDPIDKINILARAIAKVESEHLPDRIDDAMVVRAAIPFDGGIQFQVFTIFSQDDINQVPELTSESFMKSFEAAAKDKFCKPSNAMMLIQYGGIVRQVYQFKDGTIWMKVEITECEGDS